MNLAPILMPTFTQMLGNLRDWIERGAEHAAATGTDAETVLTWQLAPDMYPLAGQLRFACFLALEPFHRIANATLPAALEVLRGDGWASKERPGSLSSARELIEDAIAELQALQAAASGFDSSRRVELKLPSGENFILSSDQYLRDWAIPQFYFHVNMSYAILRSRGVELGKRDYVKHMLAYIS